MPKKLNTEEFINKAKKVHGDKFDYSKVEYVNSNTKIIIICPIHGEFEQLPTNHLKGCGCNKCGRLIVSTNKTLTTEYFIKMAKKIHGEKYNYSKVEYVNIETKVCITCPIHGEFWQTPHKHLNNKHGCPKCGKIKQAKKRALTTEIFIKRSKEKFGDKFDYSKVNYINNRTKVCIICPIHGEFFIKPYDFLISKHGCSLCSTHHKNNKEEFIEKAKEIHGNKYDYSKVEYVNYSTKVCIICPIHGEFWQMPMNHLKGKGCLLCGNEMKGKTLKLTTEEFIKKAKEIHGNEYDYSKVEYINNRTKICIISQKNEEIWITPYKHLYSTKSIKHKNKQEQTDEFIKKAKEVHGDKYNYSKVEYVNSYTKVCIICPIHGEFWQRPDGHLEGKGCLYCSNRKKLTTDEFIEKAKKVHGNKYDYSKVKYVNTDTKVCIICHIHGEFWQNPSNHLRGCGCSACNFSKLEKQIIKILTEKNINFECQKQFEWLGRQSLDFYLPKYNIAIECQGKQHFKPINFFGGEYAYKDRINRDKRKYKLCKNNNIKILYFTNANEHIIPKTYFDNIYRNENDIINAIQEYGNNTRT